jgi:CheY-like chemotaxis protein
MLGGWGLGLAVSRAIVDLMGGSIRAHSTPGEGSQFVVRLPLQAVTRSAVPVKSDLPSDFSGRRVLLVDDNRVNTIVSERALARLGCEVTVAADGLEALAILDSASFDIIFMDVRMPVLDGLETTREIRKREQVLDRCTPVIALTAGALIQERESCFSAGMDDYVAKPFTHDNLRVILARWLS